MNEMNDAVAQEPVSSSGISTLRRVVSNWVLRRYPLLGLLMLAFWIPISWLLPLESFLGNALLIDNLWQVFAFSLVNLLAVVFLVAILRVLNYRLDDTGTESLVTWVGRMDSLWSMTCIVSCFSIAAISPLLLLTVYGNELAAHWLTSSLFSRIAVGSIVVAAGLSVGWLLVGFLSYAQARVIGKFSAGGYFLPFSFDRDETKFGLRIERRVQTFAKWDVQSSDVQLLVVLLMLAFLHWSFMRLPVYSEHNLITAPLALVLIIWILATLLAGIAYRSDKYHIPALLVLLACLVCSNSVATLLGFGSSTFDLASVEKQDLLTEKFLAIRVSEAAALNAKLDRRKVVLNEADSLKNELWNAVLARFKNQQPKGTFVVVTCPGGGIHAAAWSSYVLSALSDEYETFSSSLGVVSGVSGGAVGSLHFLDRNYIEKSNTPDEKGVFPAFRDATTSSLESIAAGLTTDDLYGVAIPWLRRQDRGRRLESSIASRLSSTTRAEHLGSWGQRAQRGDMPIVVFNATDAATGRRVLFDTLPTPIRISTVGLTSRPFNYRELIATGHDCSPATAARVSASFPYVSPFARPRLPSIYGEQLALGDGGYVDNEGIVSAVDWIEFLLERQKEWPFEKILLLRIVPSSNTDDLVPKTPHGLVRSMRFLSGPLEALTNVRTASQSERGNLESDLAAIGFNSGLTSTVRSASSSDEPASMEEAKKNKSGTKGYNPTETAERLRKLAVSNQARDSLASKRFEQYVQMQPENELNAMIEAASEMLRTEASSELAVDPPGKGQDEKEEEENGDQAADRESLVLILEVPFELPPDKPANGQTSQQPEERVIPLNWKLSSQQKSWYEKAWTWNLKESPQLQSTLDELFERKKSAPSLAED